MFMYKAQMQANNIYTQSVLKNKTWALHLKFQFSFHCISRLPFVEVPQDSYDKFDWQNALHRHCMPILKRMWL